ncbi:MAG: T9SS type A sorting domain-containing protein, partial [candidate division Zixibacteria bacterium]|nr:T9SS type A sorting domain-containing protein [candidate division Zixibacteria bacterium]
PIRCIEFYNGGIWVCPKDSLDDRGDVNLNGVAYEIADAVLFSSYFIHGLSVFQVNVAGQVAATDVNADGVTLSVADLVLLIRVIIGDANPIPKIAPHDQPLVISTAYSEGRLDVVTEATSDIGAALLVFDLGADVAVGELELGIDADGMNLIYTVKDGQLRVLVFSLSTSHVAAGTNDLIRVSYGGRGDLRLTESQIVDYQGRPYECVNKGAQLPGSFTLRQNYPNPFNPITSISFSLPRQSAWTLRIYNITGKLVREFEGSAAAGDHTITWNGLDAAGNSAASGVYFYRFEAAGYTETKKMVLLK